MSGGQRENVTVPFPVGLKLLELDQGSHLVGFACKYIL